MQLIEGVRYNLKGLKMGLRTPKLLILGLLRFIVVIFAAIGLASIILIYQNDIVSMIWIKPESLWIVWLWYVMSWLITIILVIMSTLMSYLISQIIFAVLIMDKMSRITEGISKGNILEQHNISYFRQLIFLVKQEIPRTTIPVLLSLVLLGLGWLTPLGPVVTILSSAAAVIFLAWDNTDLVPARRFVVFRKRFGFFSRNFSFHAGFGLLFLIPFFNILSLSFAPIGATLYSLDKEKS